MNQAITTSFSRPIGEQEFAKIVTIEYELQSSIRICCLKVKLFNRNYCSFHILFICFFFSFKSWMSAVFRVVNHSHSNIMILTP